MFFVNIFSEYLTELILDRDNLKDYDIFNLSIYFQDMLIFA